MSEPTVDQMAAWCEAEAAKEREEWEKTANCTVRWAQHDRGLANVGLMIGAQHSERHAMLTAIAARLRQSTGKAEPPPTYQPE
jgi:hypothetical protein